ncbi:MFS general substrate transporter [Dissoconium aciculare CBS 342.82]|uniref:MFS general substrate transporter n=1 Tax=Dissoconium aciculare CBS 342.82 TaxID=1314786 RepID=A0A6J3M4S4_9PEZI|nr:MFS general substrate transporter [Dissoconium aciculare CBS 342.82]KAF1823031.1 MFS general substrate transporter [Dissoconium aciculare CBS 342.82]
MAPNKEEITIVETATTSSGEQHEEKIVIKRADDAFQFAADAEEISWTPAEERRVVRKIDVVILPLLFIGAALGYADAQAFGFAAIFGMIQDLKLYHIPVINGVARVDLLDTERYSLAAAMPQLGSLVLPMIALYLAQYVSYGKLLGIMGVYTGLLATLTVVCRGYEDVLALRFFYGLTSVIGALAVIVTPMWWKTDEQPLRVGTYIAGSALGNLIGQAVDLGAISIQGGVYAGHEWKWIFVILGVIAMAYGVVATIAFPSAPMRAWFLNAREKQIAVRRLAKNNTGIQTRSFKWKQVVEGVLDPQVWLLGIYSFAFSFNNNALGSFGAFLVSSFGVSPTEAIKLSMPISAIAVVCMVSSGILGTLFPRHRILIAMAYIAPSIIGNVILWKVKTSFGSLLGGLYIAATFYGALIQGFSLIAANTAGHTKKTVINGIIVIISNLGGFAGPFAYKAKEAPQNYPTGQISAIVLLVASLVSFTLLNFYYRYQNRRKITQREQNPELVNDPNLAFLDLTDKQNPAFIYST